MNDTKNTTTTNENSAMSRTTDIDKVRELALKETSNSYWPMSKEDYSLLKRIISKEERPLKIFQDLDCHYDPICPHPRFYCDKLSLLMKMEGILSSYDMYEVMRYVWTTCGYEVNRLSVSDAKAVLRMLRDCTHPIPWNPWGLMNVMEHVTYQALPEELTIYRMAPNDKRRSKFFSWTIDLKRVMQNNVLPRFGGGDSCQVCKAKVKKKDVLTYFAENSEVVVNPNKVFDAEEYDTRSYHEIMRELAELKNSYSEDVVEDIYTRNLDCSSEIKDMRAAIESTRNILQETCNIETAQFLGTYKTDLPSDSSLYYEEHLYQQNTGEFFLVGEGGAMSKYRLTNCLQGCRRSIPITQAEANIWIASKLSPGLKGAGDESTVVDFQRGLAS